jgi:hypothetical protein
MWNLPAAKEHAAFARALAKLLQRTCQPGSGGIPAFDSMSWRMRLKAKAADPEANACFQGSSVSAA